MFLNFTTAGEPLVIHFFRLVSKDRPPPPLKICLKWDLSLVLQELGKAPFEPLEEFSIRNLTL